MRGRTASGTGAAAAAAAVGIALHVSAAGVPDMQAVEAMEKFLARPASAHQYRASRRLEASGSGQRGWLDVQTSFTTASGLQYEITAEGGSGYIRTRVLHSLLDEERRLIANGRAPGVAISTANYLFRPEGINEEGLVVVHMKARRKDRSLINGRLFLMPLDGDLVRVEGTLAKNPSFWVTRVNVVRSYRRIDGALMPVELDTTAQLRLLGSSALRMTYRYSHIDEQPVSDHQLP
ncbi:MAG: hypothetical protein HYY76_15405 [Acidobacteria bacterium]|nr:hypothetical protein [Acidobacteriota bacterium]